MKYKMHLRKPISDNPRYQHAWATHTIDTPDGKLSPARLDQLEHALKHGYEIAFKPVLDTPRRRKQQR